MSLLDNKQYRACVSKITKDLPFQGERILVTGATGLIGSCIIDTFLLHNMFSNNKYTIYALSRNVNKLENRFGSQSEYLKYIEGDINNSFVFPTGLDYIIHAASNASPEMYIKYPVETIMTNVNGSLKVLEYCRTSKKTRVLFTSSFEVYGQGGKDEYEETDYGLIDLNLLRNCYPESKRVSEMLFRSYAAEYDVDIIITRLCSIYGATMSKNDSKAHAQFLRNALNNENITLKSKGLQRRSYMCVFDAVSAILTVMFKGNSGEIYNIANCKSVASIADVADTVAKVAGLQVDYKISSKFESNGYSRPQDCVLNTAKLDSLGWKGAYTLLDGIKVTYEILHGIFDDIS